MRQYRLPPQMLCIHYYLYQKIEKLIEVRLQNLYPTTLEKKKLISL